MAGEGGGGTVHIIGAGLAGLAAAVRLVAHGRRVVLWDGAPQAGGRARSFHDDTLGAVIDNGHHLMLAGNHAIRALVSVIGAQDEVTLWDQARFPFYDIATGASWVVHANDGIVPWWMCMPARRPPGTGAFGLLRDWRRLMAAGPDQTVADVLSGDTPAFHRFWTPLAVAVLNTSVNQGSARLLANVVKETLGRGGAAARPMVARRGLSALFADPAIRFLDHGGGDVRLAARIKGLQISNARVTGVQVNHRGRVETVSLADGDRLILAVPPDAVAGLVPGLETPDGHNAILNAHFRLPDGVGHRPGQDTPLMGLVGGQAEWVFRRADVVSVTVSAANDVIDQPAEALADVLWRDVCKPLGFEGQACPPSRVIKERRATFAATPENERRRPGTTSRFANLFLAGDWTATGLPATLEGAVRSGFAAADEVLKAAN